MPGSDRDPPAKTASRSSIRHSLNLPSVAKALVDAMHKDDKIPKRRESARLSIVAAPRVSLDSKLPPPTKLAAGTPDKTITRHTRRASVAAGTKSSSEEGFVKQPQDVNNTRASIRARPATSSGLPKYRPKSGIIREESRKSSPSPLRAGVRRRLSCTDDEKDEKIQNEAERDQTLADKAARPISPLPQRAALKANLTSSVNATTALKTLKSSPSSSKNSPARPTKVFKTAPNATIPRPSSSSSSSGSLIPRTPKTPPPKRPTKQSPASVRYDDSPLSRLSKRQQSKSKNADMSLISEAGSEDGEIEDVAKLLAPVAILGAPTPAMPRLESRRPQVRPAQSPTRQPRTEPLPEDTESPPTLRVNATPPSNAPRGSILSFEQLANTSQTLREEDIQSMLSDIPAPFRSGASSPPLRHSVLLSVPESPCLSAMNSPGGYGSISQVLLPDVTPSPAVHPRQSRSSELPAVDAAIVTLLKLQLASAENLAKERLNQLQALEEENHDLRQKHVQDVESLSNQIGILEQQVRGNLEAQERTEEGHASYAASLEDQLRHAEAFREQDVENAVSKALASAEEARKTAMRAQTLKWEKVNAAQDAGLHWSLVHNLATSELRALRGDRDILKLLLSDLDMLQTTEGLSCS